MTQEQYFKLEDDKNKLADVKDFIEYHTLAAELINKLLRERGDTKADKMIRWLSMGCLVGNDLAVSVAMSVYRRYLNMVHSTAETIVDDLLTYYEMLGKYLNRAGVDYER